MGKILSLSFGYRGNHGRLRLLNSKSELCGLIKDCNEFCYGKLEITFMGLIRGRRTGNFTKCADPVVINWIKSDRISEILSALDVTSPSCKLKPWKFSPKYMGYTFFYKKLRTGDSLQFLKIFTFWKSKIFLAVS